ncbi:unnamed protein product, partial [Urochloa humidicola]
WSVCSSPLATPPFLSTVELLGDVISVAKLPQFYLKRFLPPSAGQAPMNRGFCEFGNSLVQLFMDLNATVIGD